ncbi:lipase [Enterococcus sp. AZ126]|uniref:lipase n=1 Tax=Enterococcus sp. AZ126 TaxID=2774635 RepID=UPI003F291EDA
MNITDKNYNKISDAVYWLDPNDKKKYDPTLKEGEIRKLGENKFKILKIQENSKTDGMQAMAVAPLDKKGNVDTSQIVITYAGTNPKDFNDLETDLRTVGGFFDKTTSPGFSMSPSEARLSGQLNSAIAFADSVKQDYSGATISTTGHSLGEFLALYIAAENQWKNVGFNGPDPYELLSVDAKKWIKENPGLLTNYRNRADMIGNLMGNGTGAEIKVSMEMGLQSLGTYHDLGKWTFDKDGRLIIKNNDYNKGAIQEQAERQLRNQFFLGMYTLEMLKKKFTASGGGLSTNEQIYLDNSQALAVVQYASSEFEAVMTNTVKIYQDGIRELEELWQKIYSKAFSDVPDLSYGEVMDVLESSGSTERSMVTEPSEKFREKIQKAKKMSEQFNQLASEIKGKISELVQRDQELARQLG